MATQTNVTGLRVRLAELESLLERLESAAVNKAEAKRQGIEASSHDGAAAAFAATRSLLGDALR